MTTYAVDMPNVDTIAGEMETITQLVRTTIQQLEEEAQSSLQNWTGDAKATYATCKAKWDAAAENMAQASAQATSDLYVINSAYSQGEQQGVSLWESA